jgi:hypothetical protein
MADGSRETPPRCRVYRTQRTFTRFAAKWARQDSNLRPTGYEPAALPLSYEPVLSATKKSGLHGNRICLERETGFEPATPCLEGRNSTTELLPRNRTYSTRNLTVGKQEQASASTMQSRDYPTSLCRLLVASRFLTSCAPTLPAMGWRLTRVHVCFMPTRIGTWEQEPQGRLQPVQPLISQIALCQQCSRVFAHS